jgi:hypothetical protein
LVVPAIQVESIERHGFFADVFALIRDVGRASRQTRSMLDFWHRMDLHMPVEYL